MSIVLLIDETALKRFTVLNDNVDVAYINPSIIKAQDIGLQPLIGTVLYKKLCELVTPAGNPPARPIDDAANVAYKTLLDDYITPYLSNKVLEEVQWALFAKLRNNGIITSQDQQTQQLSIGDCEYLRKKYQYDADFYGRRMTDYLCANSTQYPEWKKRNSVADISADRDAYKTCITL